MRRGVESPFHLTLPSKGASWRVNGIGFGKA